MKIKVRNVETFYINLDRDVERKKRTEEMLKLNRFKSYTRVQAFDRDDVTWPNSLGYCPSENTFKHSVAVAHSHLKSLRGIKKLPALILEDDLVARGVPDKILAPDNADALFLGTAPMTMKDSLNNFHSSFFSWDVEWVQFDESIGTKDCYRLYGMLGGYSTMYITEEYVNAAIESFTESADTGIPIDVIQRRMQESFNVYATSKSIFVPWNVGYGAIDLQSFVAPSTAPQIFYDT